MASPVRVLLFGGLGLLATVLFSKTVLASDGDDGPEEEVTPTVPPPAQAPAPCKRAHDEWVATYNTAASLSDGVRARYRALDAAWDSAQYWVENGDDFARAQALEQQRNIERQMEGLDAEDAANYNAALAAKQVYERCMRDAGLTPADR